MHSWAYSKEKVEFIINSYQRGKNTKQIANELNTYNTTIRRILIRNNIKLRSSEEVHRKVHYNPFNLNSRDSRYWLGLLCADGCLTKGAIVLCLKEEDKYQLENFAKFVSSEINLTKQWNKKYNIYEYSVRFRNSEIYQYLIDLGITERKSFTLNLNFDIDYDVLRGIFDGDGSFVFCNNNNSGRFSIITGSEKFANQIYTFLVSEGYNAKLYKRDNLFTIDMFRIKELISLYDRLYYNIPNYYLVRKKLKFDYIINKYKEKNNIH